MSSLQNSTIPTSCLDLRATEKVIAKFSRF